MEQILKSLDVAWNKADDLFQEINCEVIYMSTYICFVLTKINNHSFEGDVYRLTLPPYREISNEIRMFIDKLAYSGLKFMYETNLIHTVNCETNRSRIRNELFPTFEIDDEFYDNPDYLDDAMFDSAEECINNIVSQQITPAEMASEIFEIGKYIKYWDDGINSDYFTTGDRWLSIGMILLIIAQRNRDESLASVIIYVINQIISRLGATADIEFIMKAKEFATNNTSNKLLEIWNNKLLDTINSHNRIFYEI